MNNNSSDSMMKDVWLFRVASKAENGGGHVARSLVLAAAWKEQIIFCLDEGSPYQDMVRQAGYDVVFTNEIAGHFKGIFLDVYSTENFDFYRECTQCLMIIESFKDFYDKADIYLRPFPAQFSERKALTLSGLQYALIGSQYQKDRDTSYQVADINTLTIAMGRYDSPNTTHFILDVLKDYGGDFHTNVVLGGQAAHLDFIKTYLEKDYGRPYTMHVDLPGLAKLYAQTDILFTSGAGACLEACAMKVPCIVMSFADDQRQLAAYMKEKGMVLYVGHYRDGNVTKDDLKQALDQAYDTQTRQAMITRLDNIDTNGSARVYQAVCDYMKVMEDAA